MSPTNRPKMSNKTTSVLIGYQILSEHSLWHRLRYFKTFLGKGNGQRNDASRIGEIRQQVERNFRRWRNELILTVRIRKNARNRLVLSKKTGCSFHSFEPILSKRAKKKSPANPLVYRTFWRRVRDSNPRSLSAYSISSLLVSVSTSGRFMSVSGRFV